MKIRTLYFKVKDIEGASRFWEKLLQVKPHKRLDRWHEFWCGNMCLGLLLNDFNDIVQGSGCVPVFEFEDDVLQEYIERARKLGATVVLDGLENPVLKSVVFRDPFWHEFELSKFHD